MECALWLPFIVIAAGFPASAGFPSQSQCIGRIVFPFTKFLIPELCLVFTIFYTCYSGSTPYRHGCTADIIEVFYGAQRRPADNPGQRCTALNSFAIGKRVFERISLSFLIPSKYCCRKDERLHADKNLMVSWTSVGKRLRSACPSVMRSRVRSAASRRRRGAHCDEQIP